MERTSGRDLLADELSCLSFWLALSKDSHLQWEGMQDLLGAFRFNVKSESAFREEFAFLLEHNPRELAKEGEQVYRFDLARQIFLERGL